MDQPQEQPQFQYRVLTPNSEYKKAQIEKSGIKATFTIEDIEDHEKTLATFKKEREAEVEVELAKMENIRHFHPVVDELTGEQLVAAALFKESKTIVEKNRAKLREVDAALKEYADEKDTIMKTLGFVPTTIDNGETNTSN